MRQHEPRGTGRGNREEDRRDRQTEREGGGRGGCQKMPGNETQLQIKKEARDVRDESEGRGETLFLRLEMEMKLQE